MARVRRPPDKEEFIATLTDGKPFQTYREVLVFAAALGFARGRREPFEGGSDVAIRWELFREVGGDALAAMIAAIATDEVTIVAPDRTDERVTVFEEFANGGLSELQAALQKHPERGPTDVILEMVLAEESVDGPPPDLDLSSIAEEFSA